MLAFLTSSKYIWWPRGCFILKHIYRVVLSFRRCPLKAVSNTYSLVGCCSGDKLGHHQSPRECPEEAFSPLTRGPGPIQIRRLPGRHLWGHPASCGVSYLWRQSPWDHRGTEEESCYCCACGAEEVRTISLSQNSPVTSDMCRHFKHYSHNILSYAYEIAGCWTNTSNVYITVAIEGKLLIILLFTWPAERFKQVTIWWEYSAADSVSKILVSTWRSLCTLLHE